MCTSHFSSGKIFRYYILQYIVSEEQIRDSAQAQIATL